MRQAGRYMPEYRAIRKQHSCSKLPEARARSPSYHHCRRISRHRCAIIFADLLLPLEVMGLPFHFSAGEGPVIEKPVRTAEDIAQLRTDRAAELGYVAEAVSLVAKTFCRQNSRDPVSVAHPFTLASYMIEGGGSRNYLHAKTMMYNSPTHWDALSASWSRSPAEYSAGEVRAGADVIQISQQLGRLPQRWKITAAMPAPRHLP